MRPTGCCLPLGWLCCFCALTAQAGTLTTPVLRPASQSLTGAEKHELLSNSYQIDTVLLLPGGKNESGDASSSVQATGGAS